MAVCFGWRDGGSVIGVRFLLCFWTMGSLVIGGVNGQVNLPLFGIEKWAEVFGQTIYDICAKATALADIRTDYILMDPKVRPVHGESLVEEMKIKMEEMLRQKINAVQRLVKVAERSYFEHVYDKDISISYYMAKKLNTTEFLLEENEHFNYIDVNLTMSTVHVPTNVYDQSAAVLNGVAWSEVLDGTFIKNYEEDPTSTWQYFCSASGFLRNFPGTVWRTEEYRHGLENVNEKNIDVFDCRVRRWYIQAAAYPKDVVILLDSSGSMKGLRIEIAKATVEKILDTLGDDDFFNVIKYSDTIEYVDSCFNATMVQASENNKKRVKESLSVMKTQNIANLNLALVEAFELLLATNDSGRGSLCNKAIMIVTDGATDTYEEIFDKYNSPKANVRVFTYLIGREVGDSRNVLWMACRNKGRFSHITSLADVHEHVQNYVHVLSRPLVISRARLPVWTNVYLDTLVPGLELMTTIAQPVFDTKNETANNGVLLGVVGSDVPLKELTKITPPYKLGVNGYSFAITNNGYVLFHPRFKPPLQGNLERRGSYAVDLSEIELLDEDSKLRNSMVERKRGSLKIPSVIPFDQAKRGIIRENHFYFTDIEGTPFSLGISLPDGYGVNVVEGRKALHLVDLSALRTGDLTIAPWNYCKMATNETRQHPFEMLIKYLNLGKDNPAAFAERCDLELIEHLLFDAEATRGALASWMKENHDGTLNDSTSKRNGIEIIFIGTKAGLTRYFKMTENLTDPDFIQKNNSTIEEVYYTRAVDNGETSFTFSVPFNPEKVSMSETVLTVSAPIVISEEGREGVAAVVGLQMKYSKFYEVFLNVTRTCPQKGMNCNQTCESDEINCYLLDNNGYVIASKNPKDVGQFFGELEGNGALMRELIMDDDLSEVERLQQGFITKKIFRRIQMIDYQATCDIFNTVGLGASSIFLSPLGRLFSGISSILNELLLFFLQFSLLDWWRGATSFANDNTADGVTSSYDVLSSTEYVDISTDYGQYYDDLNQSNKNVMELMRECSNLMNDPQLSRVLRRKKFKDCIDNIRQKFAPRIIGRRPCIQKHTFYAVDPTKLPMYGEVTRCPEGEKCTNHYSVNRVPGTNLMLLVVDAVCTCSNEPPVSLEPVEIKYNNSFICQKLQNEVFRKRPKFCHAYHENENYTDCGRCGLLQASTVVLLVSLPLTYFTVPH